MKKKKVEAEQSHSFSTKKKKERKRKRSPFFLSLLSAWPSQTLSLLTRDEVHLCEYCSLQQHEQQQRRTWRRGRKQR